VADDITLDAPHALELRFHPEATKAEPDGTAFLMRGKQSVLRLQALMTDGVTVTAEDVKGESRAGEAPFDMFTVRLAATQAHWRNATALSWSKTNPVPVALRRDGDRWTFTAGGRSVTLDWTTGQATQK
jgi:hypothetical protein